MLKNSWVIWISRLMQQQPSKNEFLINNSLCAQSLCFISIYLWIPWVYFSGIWEMWKRIIGHMFSSRDVIRGMVGELDSCHDFCPRAWTVTQPLVSYSLHSSLKKAESKKDNVWTGQRGQGLPHVLWCWQCYQQPCWRETAVAPNSPGEELRLRSSPPKRAAHLTVQPTSKPQKVKQCTTLAQRAYLVKGTSNGFGRFYYYSNLQFSSHMTSLPK